MKKDIQEIIDSVTPNTTFKELLSYCDKEENADCVDDELDYNADDLGLIIDNLPKMKGATILNRLRDLLTLFELNNYKNGYVETASLKRNLKVDYDEAYAVHAFINYLLEERVKETCKSIIKDYFRLKNVDGYDDLSIFDYIVLSDGNVVITGLIDKSVKNIRIPSNVVDIEGAFGDCDNIESVVIGYGLKTIGDRAFYCCKNLKNIIIPKSVTTINSYAFYHCESLKTVELHDNVKILSYAFSGTAVESVTFPKCMKSITSAFAGCNQLTKVIILDGAVAIEDQAFECCTNLKNVVMPESVKTIGEKAFYGCCCLENINLPQNVNAIGNYAFAKCESLKEVALPNKIKSWEGEGVFCCCKQLEKVILPNKINTIGRYCFNECESLKEIIIPRSVTSIEPYAFKKCSILKSLSISSGVTVIGKSAFRKTGLKELFIDKSNTFNLDLEKTGLPATCKIIRK